MELSEAQLCCFVDALLDAINPANFSSQANFTDKLLRIGRQIASWKQWRPLLPNQWLAHQLDATADPVAS